MDNKIEDNICDYDYDSRNFDNINHVVVLPCVTINSSLLLF
jgi:hypothetical protein